MTARSEGSALVLVSTFSGARGSATRRCRIAFAVAFLLLVFPAVSSGQQGDADAHFQRGVALFRREEYQDALRAFEAARAIRETPSVVLNIANCLQALFRNGEALVAFQRFLEVRGERLTPDERRRVDRAFIDLRGRVAELTVETNILDAQILVDGRLLQSQPVFVDIDTDVRVEARRDGYRPAQTTARSNGSEPFTVTLALEQISRRSRLVVVSNVPSAVVSIDGREVGRSPWEGVLEPGSYALVVQAVGYEPAQSRVEVLPGENVRQEMRLVPSVEPGASDEPLLSTTPQPPSRSSALPWILVGAGAAAIGAGVAIWLLASQPLEGDLRLSPP